MTSSDGNIFRVTGPLCEEFTGPDEFPTQRPVTRNFDVFFDLRLNKMINGWVNNRGAGDLRRHSGHYDVSVMSFSMIHDTMASLIISELQERSGYLSIYTFLFICGHYQ